MIEKQKEYLHGTGRRKTAVAQVKLFKGNGAILVDGQPFEERFNRVLYRQTILKPFEITGTMGKYDAVVKVNGGGITGQCEAIRHGIARALAEIDEKFHHELREGGLLTRDPRIKERKKPGLKRARKAPQYTKR
ncbi:MAG: 30S ribosomal protein S9 [Dehalococcoidaceae bacterium]|nr:30S ribosomal protein S9 [Dehalococcoidaceae bacterium]